MENYIIDIDSNIDMKDIVAESGEAAITNDVRVIIRQGVSKQEVHKALQAVSSVLIGDQIILDSARSEKR
jgi:2-methylaconitate cis-trans-isomerase PrpF